jgi:hypothetical protein
MALATDPQRVNHELARSRSNPRYRPSRPPKIPPAPPPDHPPDGPDPTGQLARKAMAAREGTRSQGHRVQASRPTPRRTPSPPTTHDIRPSPTSPRSQVLKGEQSESTACRVVTMTDKRLPLPASPSPSAAAPTSTNPPTRRRRGLATEMLRRGSTRSLRQAQRALDSKGISIGCQRRRRPHAPHVTCPSDQLDEAVRLAASSSTSPTSRRDQFDRLKAQAQQPDRRIGQIPPPSPTARSPACSTATPRWAAAAPRRPSPRSSSKT